MVTYIEHSNIILFLGDKLALLEVGKLACVPSKDKKLLERIHRSSWSGHLWKHPPCYSESSQLLSVQMKPLNLSKAQGCYQVFYHLMVPGHCQGTATLGTTTFLMCAKLITKWFMLLPSPDTPMLMLIHESMRLHQATDAVYTPLGLVSKVPKKQRVYWPKLTPSLDCRQWFRPYLRCQILFAACYPSCRCWKNRDLIFISREQ